MFNFPPIIYTSEVHGRTAFLLELTQESEMLELLTLGYRLYKYTPPNQYLLRLPELTLLDISRIRTALEHQTLDSIVTILININDILDELLSETATYRVEGRSIETSIIISGYDLHSLLAVREKFFKKILGLFKNGQDIVNILIQELDLSIGNVSNNGKAIYQNIKEYYGHQFKTLYLPYLGFSQIEKIPSPLDYWKNIFCIGGVKVFVAHGCIDYALSYYEATGDENIAFTEIHLESDPYSLFRKSPLSETFHSLKEGIDLSEIVVIDKSYSGNTLSEVKRRFGDDSNVKIVALYPKSASAVKSADYIVWRNAFLHSSIVPLTEDWHIELFLKTNEYHLASDKRGGRC